MSPPEFFMLSIILIMLGLFLVFVSLILWSFRSGGRVEGGGAILIGPIPIVFGSSMRMVKVVLILAIVLMLLSLLFISLLLKL